MNELRSYYLKRLALYSICLALLLLILERTRIATLFNNSEWRIGLLGVLVSTPAVVAYMVLGERLIRKALWKLKVAEYDGQKKPKP